MGVVSFFSFYSQQKLQISVFYSVQLLFKK